MAYIGVFASLVLIILLTLTERPIFIIVGFLTLFSCLVWIFIRNRINIIEIYISNRSSLILNIIFFILLTIILLSLFLRPEIYERPLIFFFLSSFLIGILSLEIILSNKKDIYLILYKIIIVAILLAFSQLYIFPNVVGIDPWVYQMFVEKILNLGSIPPGFPYSNLPLFHLAIAELSMIANINYKIASGMIGILQIIIKTMIIFLLVNMIFENHKISLLSTLFVNISTYNIFMSGWVIPNTLGLIFAVLIVFLLYKNQKSKKINLSILILFLMVILISTHHLTSMIIAIVLFIIYITNMLLKHTKTKDSVNNKLNLTILIFFVVFMFSWWLYMSGHIEMFARLLKWGFSVDRFASKTIVESFLIYQKTVPFIEQLLNNIGKFLFFSLSFIGIFYMISKKYGNFNSFSIALIGLIPLAIGFLTMISGMTVVEDRWFYFAEVFLSIPLAISIFILSKSLKKSVISSILIMVISFLIIISPLINFDNSYFSPNTHVRYAFKESEIIGANFLVKNSARNISADYEFTLPINNYFGKGEEISSSTYLDKSLDNKSFRDTNLTLAIRKEILDSPFRLYGSAYYKLNYNPLNYVNQDFNRIYDNSEVFIYVNSRK